MALSRQSRRVRIYFGESDHYEGKPLFSALLDFLRAEGAAGATVTRGIAGFRGAQPDSYGVDRRSLQRPASAP